MAYTTIDDGSLYFQSKIWSGNGSAGTSITNDGNSDLQPDFFWAKVRNHTYNHIVLDSTRGTSKRIIPNATDAEDTFAGFMNSFDADGFTLNTDVNTNESGKTYVAWQWKANGGTTTSFSASGAQLAGTRQSNTTAGFSIITYTGDGNNNATIPHGLSSAVKFVMIKDRGNITNWYVGHDGTFTTGEIFLNSNSGVSAAFGPFNKTAPTSTNIVLGTDGNVNGSGDSMICYAFSEVQGYSKFGTYTGNGSSSDGPFVYTGFKPAFLITKKSSASDHWKIYDNQRDPFNDGSLTGMKANSNDSEADSGTRGIDLLSNGFKIREGDGDTNGVGQDFIYMAFAEHPFVSSEGVPVTAR